MLESLTRTETPTLPYAYGFDDVALVPGMETVDPSLCDVSWRLDASQQFDLPIIAAAMDGVVDAQFAIEFHRQGGLAVLNLEGLHGRYEDVSDAYREIAAAGPQEAGAVLARLYEAPVRADYLRRCIRNVKVGSARLAVSFTPMRAQELVPVAAEEGADVLVLQSTVTSPRHQPRSGSALDIADFCSRYSLPVIVGNTVAYEPALELMRAGVAAILVGVGPGAECTSREVLGIGLPQISATLDVAAARDTYYRESGRYVSVVTDGGMRVSGDMVKALAAGADAIMLGAPLAQAHEAPGLGFNWGMASFHNSLPRGTRINLGVQASLQQILYGPSEVNSGTQNLVGAIRTAMGVLGARTISDLHQARMVHAPTIKTEGKLYQHTGRI
jgi:IMP dehydrogenase